MSKPLKLETIRAAMGDPDWGIRRAIMYACEGQDDVPLEIIQAGLWDPHPSVCSAAADAFRGRKISFKTIRKWQKSENKYIRIAALRACEGRKTPLDILQTGLGDEDEEVCVATMRACKGQNVPLEIIQAGLWDPHPSVRSAAADACRGRKIPFKIIREWQKSEERAFRVAAMRACKGRDHVPPDILRTGLEDRGINLYMAAIEICKGQKLSLKTIKEWQESESAYVRIVAMHACERRQDIPLKILESGLEDSDINARQATLDACRGRKLSLKTLKKWSKHKNRLFRVAAMRACKGQDNVPLEILQTGLNDPCLSVREAAIDAHRGCNMPFETIREWQESENWAFRTAAMCACERRAVPPGIIEAGLDDSCSSVRKAAIATLFSLSAPYSRTFEPKGLVYKKCLNDVTIVAEIPQDAHIRGGIGEECRASKAIIKEIIGNFYGEKVGVSSWDNCTFYHEGDIIEIKDFDLSYDKYSTGFHFFNSLDEAREY